MVSQGVRFYRGEGRIGVRYLMNYRKHLLTYAYSQHIPVSEIVEQNSKVSFQGSEHLCGFRFEKLEKNKEYK